MALLLYGAYVSYLGLRSGETPLPPGKLKRAFYGATTVFLGCLIGGMIFPVIMGPSEEMQIHFEIVDLWLDWGFYGGVICGGLTAWFFRCAFEVSSRLLLKPEEEVKP